MARTHLMPTSASPDFEQYAAQLEAAGRICVMGIYWDKLFTIIVGSKKREAYGEDLLRVLAQG